MHPRNIYKTPPDFSKLVVKYHEFSKIATIDLNGTVRIDFKDVNSLRVLTKCLLHSDFNLTVDIPENKLVPTVPLRLNYLLWIEDLLNFFEIKNNIKGIDIGTGSSCIYPLLGSKKFQWKMLGTEVDEESLKFASKNIKENKLDDYITVKKTTPDGNLLLDCLNGEFSSVDFCMCNPPFFSSFDEIDNAISLSRAPPNNARSGSSNEIVTHGGETSFIYKLIKESLESRDSVKIYTTMLGHKSSLKTLRKFIHEFGIREFTQTSFIQGKTTRWGLAWSFSKNLNLFQESQPKKEKKGKPISFVIPQTDPSNYTVLAVTKKILGILNILEIKYKVFEKSESICTVEIIANSNTWSHQRRKRRRKTSMDDKQKDLSSCSSNDTTLEENVIKANGKKRKLDSFEDNFIETVHSDDLKSDQKINEIIVDEMDTEQANKINYNNPNTSHSDNDKDESVYLKAALCLRKHEDFLLLDIVYMSGEIGKDGVNQIVQYIKNNWS